LTFCPCYMLSPLSLSLQFPSIFYFCMIFHFHLILDFLSPRETSVKLQRLPIHAILVWVNFSTSKKKKKKRTMERKNENGNQFLGNLTLIMKVQKHEIFILIHSGSWGMLFFFHWNLESNSHLLLYSPLPPSSRSPVKAALASVSEHLAGLLPLHLVYSHAHETAIEVLVTM